MHILGIETSCDETSGAVLEITKTAVDLHINVKSQVIASQIDIHKQYGGVVPEIAARQHMQNIIPVIDETLEQSNIKINEIDLVAVTQGPGLATSLMVGLEFGKTLALTKNIPFVPVNHLVGHVFSWLLPVVGGETNVNVNFPFLSLIISGGHTELVLVKSFTEFEILGKTLDDAVGEAFDKVAKMLGLEYPGGHKLSELSAAGDVTAFSLPRPMLQSNDFNFSLAGLKTAVLYKIRDINSSLDKQTKADLAASFQTAITDVLLAKTFAAAKKFNIKNIAVVGGVSANKFIRDSFIRKAEEENIEIKLPDLAYTGDNGAMIALAGYFDYKNKKDNVETQDLASEKNYLTLSVDPNLHLV